MNREKPNYDPSYTKANLSFVKEPPEETSIECPMIILIMLKDTSLTSCGHHFCTSCIKKILDKKGSCPTCRTTIYQEIFMSLNFHE